MEDPEKEIVDVIRGLVDRPTLQRQAKYLRPDCKFYHFYLNIVSGVNDLTAIYQLAEVTLNYTGVDIHQVLYNEAENVVAVRCVVSIRPYTNFLRKVEFQVFILLELEDCPTEVQGGRKVVKKKIRVQRDFFDRALLLLVFPVIGDIYASQTLRLVIGFLQVRFLMLMRLIFTITRLIFTIFLPRMSIEDMQ